MMMTLWLGNSGGGFSRNANQTEQSPELQHFQQKLFVFSVTKRSQNSFLYIKFNVNICLRFQADMNKLVLKSHTGFQQEQHEICSNYDITSCWNTLKGQMCHFFKRETWLWSLEMECCEDSGMLRRFRNAVRIPECWVQGDLLVS